MATDNAPDNAPDTIQINAPVYRPGTLVEVLIGYKWYPGVVHVCHYHWTIDRVSSADHVSWSYTIAYPPNPNPPERANYVDVWSVFDGVSRRLRPTAQNPGPGAKAKG